MHELGDGELARISLNSMRSAEAVFVTALRMMQIIPLLKRKQQRQRTGYGSTIDQRLSTRITLLDRLVRT